jgi:hypothetical protein
MLEALFEQSGEHRMFGKFDEFFFYSNREQRQFFTLFGCFVAGISASTTMLLFVAGAFIPASQKNLHAEFTNLLREIRIAAEKCRGNAGDVGCVMAKLDAARHQMRISVHKAGCGTLFTL